CPRSLAPFCVVAVAAGSAPAQVTATLARRQSPLRLASCPQAAPLWVPRAGAAPTASPLATGDAYARRRPSCWQSAAPVGATLLLPAGGFGCRPQLQGAWSWPATPVGGLVVAPSSFLAAFAAKTQQERVEEVLHNAISSHAV
ncbi:hypothetical protein BHE74_00046719, partial [Ensete ventricosum]